MCQALDTQCLLLSELIPAAAQPHTCSHTYADADTSTRVHAHRTHRNTQTNTLMCKVHTQMSTHTHSCRLAEMCTQSHRISLMHTAHATHTDIHMHRQTGPPHTSFRSSQGNSGGLRATREAWLVQWNRVRNQVGVGDTWLPPGPPTGMLEIPQDDMSEDKGLGTHRTVSGTRGWTVPEGGLPQVPCSDTQRESE